ncbi:MAG: hypothetical protein ACXV8M_00620, partial [Candidatus Angelobacter sp.]
DQRRAELCSPAPVLTLLIQIFFQGHRFYLYVDLIATDVAPQFSVRANVESIGKTKARYPSRRPPAYLQRRSQARKTERSAEEVGLSLSAR